MVAQPGRIQASFNSGEIGEELYSRIDLKQWYSGMKRMLNVEPVPQGGFRLMQRSRIRGRVRGPRVEFGGILTSDTGEKSTESVVKQVDFEHAEPVALVEIAEFAGTAYAEIVVQYRSPDLVWHDFAPAFRLTTDSRSRFAGRPPNQPVSAVAVRVLVRGMAEPVSVSIAALRTFRENGPATEAELRSFFFAGGQAYVFVVAHGLIDIWRAGTFVGCVRTSINSGMLRGFKQAQLLDTDMLFHPDLPSEKIVRRGADHEWEYGLLTWDAIPEVDLGGSYSTTDDQWDFFVRWSSDSRPDLLLSVVINGEETRAVSYSSAATDEPAWAAEIQASILDLPSIKPGVVFEHLSTIEKMIRLRLTLGGDNGGEAFDVTGNIVNTSEASCLATHLRIGEKGGEPLISAGRGYPAAAVFFQDRLIPGGFRSKKAGIAASRVGEYFDLNIKAVGDSTALLNNLQTEGSEQITQIYAGRHVMIFTDAKEYFVSDRVIKKTEPVNFVETSRNGAHPDADIVEINDDLFYVSKNGAMIYAASYDDVSTKYQSEPVSLLASHLVKGVRDAALQRASEATDASRYMVLRADGRLIIGVVIRKQEVLGFCEWGTAGAVESLCVDNDNRPFLAVWRQVDGASVIFFEEIVDEDDLVFDAAVTRSYGAPTTDPDRLDDHEGATVYANVNGFLLGPYTVTDGAIHLPEAVSSVTVGRWTAPFAECLPRIRVVQEDIVMLRPGRIHTVNINLIGTNSLAIGANGERPRDVALYTSGVSGSGPLPPQKGRITVDGLDGYQIGPTVTFTQLRPGRLAVQDFSLEIGG